MNVVVAFDGRFYNVEGRPCSHHLTYQAFSLRYLAVFEKVFVVGRLYPGGSTEYGEPVDGDGVSFMAIPGYVGPFQFLLKFFSIVTKLWSISKMDARFILRTPGTIPFILSLFLVIHRKKFSVEVVADPFDQLSRGANTSSLRSLFRFIYTRLLIWQCRNSYSTAYVTSGALQKRYPPGNAYTFSYTSLNLSDDWFLNEYRRFNHNKGQPIKIISVGMMNQSYKGFDTLINAVHMLVKMGVDVQLEIVGGGELLHDYEQYAGLLGVSDKVKFSGVVERNKGIKESYDRADLFVLASRQEGLPRAMIEAMARGLPCIGTRVGGIPELLPDSALVSSDDPSALAEIIHNILVNAQKYEELAKQCEAKSHAYSAELIQQQRLKHYELIRGVIGD